MISLANGNGSKTSPEGVDSPLVRRAKINDRLEQLEEAAGYLAEAAKVFENIAKGGMTNTERMLAENVMNSLYINTVLIQELRKL